MNVKLTDFLYDYLLKIGMADNTAAYVNLLLLLVGILSLAWLLDYILRNILNTLSVRMASRTTSKFDNFLVDNKVPRYIAHVFPLLFLFELLPFAFTGFEYGGLIILKVLRILAVMLVLLLVKSLLRAIRDFLKTLPHLRDKPLDSYIQVFMIFAWITGILTIFAIIMNTTIWMFFTALGAASAVILLIFKDSILGLVASIQVSINDMVRIGDWITFDKYGADGGVIEITLATVKVQNFDNTITTIPTYALISDSFKNWRGMQTSGGRRIKRALILRQKSVKFLSDEKIESLKRIQLIRPYLEISSKKIADFNTKYEIDRQLPINGKNLTNLGVFRKYVQSYLENNAAINKNMTLMVRQLEPSVEGIPLEIYAFSSDKRWENYEYVMADIFDHLLAALPYFELEILEWPTALAYFDNGKLSSHVE